MTVGEASSLHDGTAHTQIAKRLRDTQRHVRERRHAKICGREKASEQHADDELRHGADDGAGEPPLDGTRRSRGQTFGGRRRQRHDLSTSLYKPAEWRNRGVAESIY
jgi:hypothetical protein